MNVLNFFARSYVTSTTVCVVYFNSNTNILGSILVSVATKFINK